MTDNKKDTSANVDPKADAKADSPEDATLFEDAPELFEDAPEEQAESEEGPVDYVEAKRLAQETDEDRAEKLEYLTGVDPDKYYVDFDKRS